MLRLLGKSTWDSAAIESLGAKRDYSRPFSVFKGAESCHTFWTIGMPMSDPLLNEICKSFRAVLWYDHEFLVVTTNTDGWYEIAQKMSDSDDKHMRQFVTILIQTFPEIFKDLNRRLRTDGTTAIMKYTPRP